FDYRLELAALNHIEVPFDKLLGQKVTVSLELPEGQKRHFNGIVHRCSQGTRDDTFTSYQVELVPQFWLLTKNIQSRIFQHQTVPDILKKVLEVLDVAFELQGTFQPREFCVQYRESDFEFASRLMEEEGIYYFFNHTANGHKMTVANSPQSHPDLAPSSFTYEEALGGNRKDDRILQLVKTQEIRSGKVTLWDHSFELPHKHLEAEKPIQASAKVGKVDHKLKTGNDKLEIYDYPGEYAKRFDGVTKSGGDQASKLQKVFEDNVRVAGIRMQEEAAGSLAM